VIVTRIVLLATGMLLLYVWLMLSFATVSVEALLVEKLVVLFSEVSLGGMGAISIYLALWPVSNGDAYS